MQQNKTNSCINPSSIKQDQQQQQLNPLLLSLMAQEITFEMLPTEPYLNHTGSDASSC